MFRAVATAPSPQQLHGRQRCLLTDVCRIPLVYLEAFGDISRGRGDRGFSGTCMCERETGTFAAVCKSGENIGEKHDSIAQDILQRHRIDVPLWQISPKSSPFSQAAELSASLLGSVGECSDSYNSVSFKIGFFVTGSKYSHAFHTARCRGQWPECVAHFTLRLEV